MTKSLMYRFGKKNKRITLKAEELKRGYAFRKRAICEIYYRVGDVRRVLDECNCSLGRKIRIRSIRYDEKSRRVKITFSKIRENYEVHSL